MLEGDLKTADLPLAWNQKYRETLGIVPGSDRDGCLQDIHWAAGLYGYFPTYTLGNLYAAQLFDQARRDLPGLDGSFSRGDFGDLLAWLRKNIHQHAQRYLPRDLIERATGRAPSPAALMAWLKQKHDDLQAL
jgi:carboxypeptidase Taq